MDELIAYLVVDLEQLEVCHVFQDLTQFLFVDGAIDEFTGSDYAYGDIGLPDGPQFRNDSRIVIIELNDDIGVAED